MNQDATSLERLHDLALPPEPAWWPLAPGWYVLLAFALVFALALLHRTWQRWRANGYRRAALRELESARGAAAIAEVLRRAALATAPRSEIAQLSGAPWADWLAGRCPEPLPESVRLQLTRGVYGRPGDSEDSGALHEYAAIWIDRHEAAPLGGARN